MTTLLEAHEVSSILGIKKETLRSWRRREIGPPYIKILKTIRYREEDLYAYLKECRRNVKGCTIKLPL